MVSPTRLTRTPTLPPLPTPRRKAKAIEFMIVDALVAADPALRISEQIHDPADFQRLDDGLIDVSAAGPGAAGGAGGGGFWEADAPRPSHCFQFNLCWRE